MNTPFRWKLSPLFILLVPILISNRLHCQSEPTPAPPAAGTTLYSENFNRSQGVNGWYAFGGGKGVSFRGDVVPFVGTNSSNAFVLTCSSDTTVGNWYSCIGRNNITPPPETTPDNLMLKITLADLGGLKAGLVTIRMVQGDSSKPSWSTSWKLPISRTPQSHELVLSQGTQSGTFNPRARMHLHPIGIGQSGFGKLEDIQIMVDDVSIVVLR